LVVEVDGSHHTEDDRIVRDARRDAYMQQQGYFVLRVPAGEVMSNADDVAQGIVEAALARSRKAR
jgi:very-short-patch-repair endonuclease